MIGQKPQKETELNNILEAKQQLRMEFNKKAEKISAMIKERESERYLQYYQELKGSQIDNLIELAILGKYTALIELFNKISKSFSQTCFAWDATDKKTKDMYKQMISYSAKSIGLKEKPYIKDLVQDLNEILKMKDISSHDFYKEDFSNFDRDTSTIQKNVRKLGVIFDVYINYLQQNDPFAPNYKKVFLK